MSWITINGVPHQCTVEDLHRWDAKAAEEGATREEVAVKELSAGEPAHAAARKAAPKKMLLDAEFSKPGAPTMPVRKEEAE